MKMKMNRQKIWFFSMFALMIVLSGYYLLSEQPSSLRDSQIVQSTTEQVKDEIANSKPSEVTDEQVLEKLETQDVEDFFTAYHMKQRDELAKEAEKYMKIITNPESSTQAISSAMASMQQLEDRSEQVTALEEKLQQHFADVIIEEKEKRWNVIVQSEDLQADQAVHIVQMATDHLKIAPSQVSVQFRP
jgi:stage III sporulation protein AH